MPYDQDCPACRERRAHTEEDWLRHPGEGRGGIEPDGPRPEQAEPRVEE